MFIDYPVVRKHNRLLPFGGATLKVNLGPALLALRHEVPVLCVDCIRTGDNRHRVVVHPRLPRPEAEDREAAAAEMTRHALCLLARGVRAHPDQWWPWDWAEISSPAP
jgi:lauroyl/myristoyl acyltransferase